MQPARTDATARAEWRRVLLAACGRTAAVCPRLRWTGFLLALVSACAVTPAHAPRSWLDDRTAATITVQAQPMVLARDEQMRAINVRDYVQLGAAELNVMGKRQLYLVLLLWSTIDRSAAELDAMEAGFARITLHADDRPIELARLDTPSTPLGFGSPPFRHPTPGAREAYFTVSAGELQSIARSRTLTLSTHGAEIERSYREWQDGRAGLSALLAQLPAQ